MREIIDEEVSVVMFYDVKKKLALPYMLRWQNKDYLVGEIGYKHDRLEGRERWYFYEFVDVDNTLCFRLRLDCGNLHWTLEAVHDGLAD